jgi:hypothetical protein
VILPLLFFIVLFYCLKHAPFRYSINGLTPGLISPIKVTTSKRVREPGNYMKRQGGPLLKTRHAVIAGKSLNKTSLIRNLQRRAKTVKTE